MQRPRRSKWTSPTVSFPAAPPGQLLVFHKTAYETIGGHAALNLEIVDDLTLARRVISAGFRWRVVYVADLIACRMYHSNQAAYNGFVKNLFAAFDFRLLPFAFVIVWLVVMFWIPLIVGLLWITGVSSNADESQLAICLALSVMVWWLPYRDLKHPVGLALIFPITITANIFVAVRSLRHSLSGQLEWT